MTSQTVAIPSTKTILSGPNNNPKIPEIYQIEIAERCNFSCDFCQTGQWYKGKSKKDAFVDIELVKLIAERDIAGSYFIELQHRGEPTLNKQMGEIIDILSPHVFLGLSTNGSLIHKRLKELLRLDYITISVDAAEKELYEKLRLGGEWETLLSNIDLLVQGRGDSPTPAIDLQLVELDDTECQEDQLEELVREKGWDVTVRTVRDSFLTINHPDQYEVKTKELCLNPFLSVSIHANGDVVPCCMTWGTEWVYGNLFDNSLEEIWNDNPKVEEFREMHRTDKNLPSFCANCYSRSPVMLHQNLYRNATQQIIRRSRK